MGKDSNRTPLVIAVIMILLLFFFFSRSNVTGTSSTTTASNSYNSVSLLVLDSVTGAPAVNIPINLIDASGIRAQGVTDQQGQILFSSLSSTYTNLQLQVIGSTTYPLAQRINVASLLSGTWASYSFTTLSVPSSVMYVQIVCTPPFTSTCTANGMSASIAYVHFALLSSSPSSVSCYPTVVVHNQQTNALVGTYVHSFVNVGQTYVTSVTINLLPNLPTPAQYRFDAYCTDSSTGSFSQAISNVGEIIAGF